VEASRTLDHYFAAVEEQPQGSSEQQEDDSGRQASEPVVPASVRIDKQEQAELEAEMEAEEAEMDTEMDTEMDAAPGDSGKPEGLVHVPAAGQQQEDRAGEHLTDEDVARTRGVCSFQGTDDDLRAWHAAATKRHEELRRQTNPIHPIAKGLRWGGEGMGWFDPKRARREERQYRKQKRLQKWMQRGWPLIKMEEDVRWSDRINRYRTRATPPGWISGCSEVEQGDIGAGVLPPSDRARDLCACSVLSLHGLGVGHVVAVSQYR